MRTDLSVDVLAGVLEECRPAAVALSGGVDSMTLAHVAHRVLGREVEMFHAASPAVPRDAGRRITEHAAREGWRLRVIDAGEFANEQYLANPANRCFFCKSSLYGTLSAQTDAQLLSGTNVDDLGDWRPGLLAAEDHAVRHPFVEAGMTKQEVRRVAASLGLEDVAELPAAPCLSSRVETGIRIQPRLLRAIDEAEALLRHRLRARTVRCRARGRGVVIELDPEALAGLDVDQRKELARAIDAECGLEVREFTEYAQGSAFLRDSTHA